MMKRNSPTDWALKGLRDLGHAATPSEIHTKLNSRLGLDEIIGILDELCREGKLERQRYYDKDGLPHTNHRFPSRKAWNGGEPDPVDLKAVDLAKSFYANKTGDELADIIAVVTCLTLGTVKSCLEWLSQAAKAIDAMATPRKI